MTDHRSPKVHRDPPTKPAPWLDPDPLTVEPEPLDERIPWHGWESMRERWAEADRRPMSRRVAVVGLVVCVAVIAAVLVLLLATPRSAPVIQPAGTSEIDAATADVASSATPGGSGRALNGAPRGVPASSLPLAALAVPEPIGSVAASPTGALGTALFSASATWCAPTPTQCQSWAPPARLAAVNAFRFGDAPWWARVWRGSTFVDVLVVSYCACGGTDGAIDLSPAAFTRLAPLSRGRIDVEIEVLSWPGDSDNPPPHPADERMREEVR